MKQTPVHPSVVDRVVFLRVLAVYKFVQMAVLAALGLATIRLVNPHVVEAYEHWVTGLPDGYIQHVSSQFLGWVAGPQKHRVLILAGALFAYSALFLAEAIGLWLQRRWAEWLTVVATGALIPPEIFECIEHPSIPLFVLLTLNVGVVWLLIVRLRHELAQEQLRHGATRR